MSQLEIDTLVLTFKVALMSAAIVVPISIATGLFMLRRAPTTQIISMSLLSLPMALPPVVTGYLLLMLLGKNSIVGGFLFNSFGIQIAFSFLGAVIASSIVSFPFALRNVYTALSSVDAQFIDAAKTLGLSPLKTIFWIVLPLSWPGILGAGILAFVRAFGEFGATVVFAGSLAGQSRTLSVELWNLMQMPDNESSMWRLLCISLLFCAGALILSEYLFRKSSLLCNER